MLEVLLSCCKNPDINMPGCKGYWSPGKRPRPMWVKVKSLAEARERCISFIACNELGGGNWNGGDVRHKGVVIARVSYNGLAWDAGSDFQIEVAGADLTDTDWS